MADSTVNVKLSTAELRTVRRALDYALEVQTEAVKAMSPQDGHALRAELLRIDDVRKAF